MTIIELNFIINNAFLGIAEYIERLIFIFFGQTPKEVMQPGDIIFLFIIFLFVLSLVLSALSIIKGYLVSIIYK